MTLGRVVAVGLGCTSTRAFDEFEGSVELQLVANVKSSGRANVGET
jgi:hypothetical protein